MNENLYANDTPRNGAVMSGFLIGAIVGAGVALLFAPATGTDTRRRIGETARKLGSAARDKFQEGRGQARDVLDSVKESVKVGAQHFNEGRREPIPSSGTTGTGRQAPNRAGTVGTP